MSISPLAWLFALWVALSAGWLLHVDDQSPLDRVLLGVAVLVIALVVIRCTESIARFVCGQLDRRSSRKAPVAASDRNGFPSTEPSFVVVALVLISTLPIAVLYAYRVWTWPFLPPLELALVQALRNATLILLLSRSHRYEGLGIASATLMGVVAGSELEDGAWMTITSCALAALWLGYRRADAPRGGVASDIDQTDISGDATSNAASLSIRATGGASARSLARAVLLAMPIVLVGMVLAHVLRDVQPIGFGRGVLPSSGGTQSASDQARGGVGEDGPDTARGSRTPSSLGFDGSDVFVNSDIAGLYDAFVESFGEPLQSMDQKKMIALKQDQIIAGREDLALDVRGGREFTLNRSTGRSSTSKPPPTDGALLWVEGDAPLHLKLATYDAFDGATWREYLPPPMKASVTDQAESGWLVKIDYVHSDFFTARHQHTLRLSGLDASALPLPANPYKLRVGRATRPNFWRGGPDGLLRLWDRNVPPGTVVEVESSLIDPNILKLNHRPMRIRGDAETLPVDPRVGELAHDLARVSLDPWQRIQAVVDHLRTLEHRPHASRDEQSSRDAPSSDSASVDPALDPIARFLFEDRRGNSADFASACVVMLRSLGYQARLASGFYVDPSEYVLSKKQTRVGLAQAHFWVELQVSENSWIVIEPTPGFSQRFAPEPWTARLVERLQRLVMWSRANIVLIVGCVVAAVAVIWQRRRIVGAGYTMIYRLSPGRTPGERLERAQRLLERRGRLWGRPREPWQTPRTWLIEVTQTRDSDLRDAALRFSSLLDQARFANPGAIKLDADPMIDASTTQLLRALSSLKDFQSPSRSTDQHAKIDSL